MAGDARLVHARGRAPQRWPPGKRHDGNYDDREPPLRGHAILFVDHLCLIAGYGLCAMAHTWHQRCPFAKKVRPS